MSTQSSLSVTPTDASGNPLPAEGNAGRTQFVAAPSWRGSFSPETFFIKNGATVVLGEKAITDEYRSYFVVVKDDTENIVWAGTVVFDTTNTPVAFPAVAAPFAVASTPDRVRMWYDSTTTSYKITNQLVTNNAYVTLFRLG